MEYQTNGKITPRFNSMSNPTIFLHIFIETETLKSEMKDQDRKRNEGTIVLLLLDVFNRQYKGSV